MKYPKIEILDPKPSATSSLIQIDKKKLVTVKFNPRNSHLNVTVDGEDYQIEPRCSAEFEQKAFYLNDDFDWVLGKDSDGMLVLIPLKKS